MSKSKLCAATVIVALATATLSVRAQARDVVPPTVTSALLSVAPDNLAPPYEFDPVTADVDVDADGALEVLAFDAAGLVDGAMLATPLDDHIQIDASFGDGYVSFELVLLDGGAAIRNVEMDLDEHVAEDRMSVMLRFAAAANDPDTAISKRGCMVRFGAIAVLCASAIGVPAVWAGATVACVGASLHTYCECLPLLGYDPCN